MEINSKMTSSNFNKIMQANLKLNSKILSKNTNEIVNTCIGKLYKQMPLTFKNDLQQCKTGAAVKSENNGPLAKLKLQDRKRQQTTANKPLKTKANSYETQMLCNLMSKKPTALMNRQLLKTSSNRIFNRKRYCSSASSSSASILYSKEDKQRATRTSDTAASNSFDKSKQQRSSFMLHKPVSLMSSNRNQHMNSNEDIIQRAIKVSDRIQRDLMAIDEQLKTRLKVSGKCQDVKAANDNKTNKVWQTSPTTGIDYRHLKETRQMFKGDELQSSKLSKGIAIRKEHSMASLPFAKAEKPLKVLKRLSQTSVQSRDLADLRIDAADKGNKLKINLRKHIRSSSRKQDNLCAGLTNVTVLENSSVTQPTESELLKPYKLNGNIAPSATYCLLKPTPVSLTKFIN